MWTLQFPNPTFCVPNSYLCERQRSGGILLHDFDVTQLIIWWNKTVPFLRNWKCPKLRQTCALFWKCAGTTLFPDVTFFLIPLCCKLFPIGRIAHWLTLDMCCVLMLFAIRSQTGDTPEYFVTSKPITTASSVTCNNEILLSVPREQKSKWHASNYKFSITDTSALWWIPSAQVSLHRTPKQICVQICTQILWCCLQWCVNTPIGNNVFHFLHRLTFASTSVPCERGLSLPLCSVSCSSPSFAGSSQLQNKNTLFFIQMAQINHSFKWTTDET